MLQKLIYHVSGGTKLTLLEAIAAASTSKDLEKVPGLQAGAPAGKGTWAAAAHALGTVLMQAVQQQVALMEGRLAKVRPRLTTHALPGPSSILGWARMLCPSAGAGPARHH
jgi:hypothetical protein